jgi:hypothetical protein
MTVLNDIALAMNSYPRDETTITMINIVKTGDSTDTDVNEKEIWDFNVQLTNNGHVDMTDVSLHIKGLNGATVREKALPGQKPNDFGPEMIVGNLNPSGEGGSRISAVFQFRAPDAEKPAGTQLVHAHVQDWNAAAGFDHFFTAHTKNDNEATDLGIEYPRAFVTAKVNPK